MESWNYNIQNIFEDRLILAFNSLDTDIARTSANTATNIKDLFSTLERELKGSCSLRLFESSPR